MEELCTGEHGPVVVNSNPVVGTDCVLVLDRVLYLEMEWSNDHGVVFIPYHQSHIRTQKALNK